MTGGMGKTSYDVAVVGAGPNGLTAALVLGLAGLSVVVLERNATIGGSCRTEPLTLPGFAHDVCGAIHAMGAVSPIFRALRLTDHGLQWVAAPTPLAHPFDDGRVAVLSRQFSKLRPHSVATASCGSDCCGRSWRATSIFSRISSSRCACPGIPGCWRGSAASGSSRAAGWRSSSRTRPHARLAGNAAHSLLPLDAPGSAAFGLVLSVAAHAVDGPCARGGSQQIVETLSARARSCGCEYPDRRGGSLACRCSARARGAVRPHATTARRHRRHPPVIVIPAAPRALPLRAGRVQGGLRAGPPRFRGARGECSDAATVHLGGTYDEIARSEAAANTGRISLGAVRARCAAEPVRRQLARRPAGALAGQIATCRTARRTT